MIWWKWGWRYVGFYYMYKSVWFGIYRVTRVLESYFTCCFCCLMQAHNPFQNARLLFSLLPFAHRHSHKHSHAQKIHQKSNETCSEWWIELKRFYLFFFFLFSIVVCCKKLMWWLEGDSTILLKFDRRICINLHDF